MQQQDYLNQQLDYAYRLLQSGQIHDAYQVLAPLRHQYPDSADLWWLLAHAEREPSHRRAYLQRLLQLDPHYPKAAEKLAQMDMALYAAGRTPALYPTSDSPQTQGRSAALQKHSRMGWWLALLAFGMLLSSLLLGGVLVVLMREEVPSISEAVSSVIQTSVAEDDGFGAAGISSLFSGPVATPDPSQFGETYWQGAGDGTTMEESNIDGRYARFYNFPVTIHVTYASGTDMNRWEAAVNNAVTQLDQVVPLVFTSDRTDADILLEVMSGRDVQRRCAEFSYTRVVGCATINYSPGIFRPIINGQALVATDTNNPTGTILHEMMHALGVVVHSPNPNDIMYFEETSARIDKLSPRDIATLARLYASPSYAD